jgi:putative hydrolase of the HAD superfamily
MPSHRQKIRQPHTVTFDCWGTLLYESESGRALAASARPRMVAELAGVDESAAASALRDAWRKHQTLWHRRVIFTGADMTREVLQSLGARLDPSRERELIDALEREVLTHEVRALEGARDALATLSRHGVRQALICDTGFTPGRVVRQLLDRAGLLEFLPVTIFSDEVGAPKPDPRAFAAALDGLGASPTGAVHVGDLRRSDVAGAKSAQMGAVRIRARNDDSGEGARGAGVIDCAAAGCEPICERPEADAVVDSFEHLLEILELG